MSVRKLLAAMCLAHMLAIECARADLITIGAMKDNTLYEPDPDTNELRSNGAGSFLFTGRTANGFIHRGLLAFDVAGAVPAGANITGATLTLHMAQTSSGPQFVGLHRTLADWGEGASDALGGEGMGAPPEPGDATWIHTFFDTDFWSAPGGDFSATSSAITSVDGVGFYDWTATPDLIADVQSWLDSPGTNFGWTILGNESTSSTSKKFDTRESAIPQNRPMLMVEFTVIPSPSAIGIFGFGLLLPRSRRRVKPKKL